MHFLTGSCFMTDDQPTSLLLTLYFFKVIFTVMSISTNISLLCNIIINNRFKTKRYRNPIRFKICHVLQNTGLFKRSVNLSWVKIDKNISYCHQKRICHFKKIRILFSEVSNSTLDCISCFISYHSLSTEFISISRW